MVIDGRIIFVDTINRYAVAIVKHKEEVVSAEFKRIEGAAYDTLEKNYGLANIVCPKA